MRRPVPLQPKRHDSLSVYPITSDPTGVQLSVALAAPVKSGDVEDSQLILAGGGQIKVGFSRSVMWMVCTQLVLLPHASVTFQVRWIVPVLLQPVGFVGLSVYVTIRLTTGVQLSLTMGLPVTDGK